MPRRVRKDVWFGPPAGARIRKKKNITLLIKKIKIEIAPNIFFSNLFD